jgi:hypothetical protein
VQERVSTICAEMEIMEITFGKNRYHLHPEMEQWCRDNIGPGAWTFDRPKTWEGKGSKIWVIYSMGFGDITFAFKNPEDATAFVLRWK